MLTNDVPVFQQHLNSIEPSTQFTFERETEGRVAFLDTNNFRKENSLLCTTSSI